MRRALLGLGLALLARPALAQSPSLPAEEGRILGAPSRAVTYLDMKPGEVQTVAIRPGDFTVIEFPMPVFNYGIAAKSLVTVEKFANKIILKAKDFSGETPLAVFLDDSAYTTVPLQVRIDSASHPLYVLRFTDPVAVHVRATERATAQRLEAIARATEAERLEQLFRTRLLLGATEGTFAAKAEQSALNAVGDRVTMQLVKVVRLHVSASVERFYLSYRVANLTRKPLEALEFRVAMVRRKGKPLEVYDFEDSRGGAAVPSGHVADGLLVFDVPDTYRTDDTFRVTLGADGGLRVVVQSAPRFP